MSEDRAQIGILISGRGSNMVALAEAAANGSLQADVALVISNRPDAPGLSRARELGLKTLSLDHRGRRRADHDAAMIEALEAASVNLVCLAGYMRLLSRAFVGHYQGRLVNIHPSLLPSFTGLDAQAQALEYGVQVSGCTVHFVDEELDHGPILCQEIVPVTDDDTVESLSERILKAEHRIYPHAVDLLARGRLRLSGRRVLRVAGE